MIWVKRMNPLTYIAIVCVIAFCVPLVGYFIVVAPADAQYNRKFASHVTMAYDQATFEGMLTQINIVWQEMNRTFVGFDFATTYNTWWYVDQTYDNSLLATNDYFNSITMRLDATIKEQEQIKSGNKTILIPYNQWYQTTLEGFRNETRREGGLDWAIRSAWYLIFQPLAYWFGWLIIAWIAIVAVFAFVIAFKTNISHDW